MACALSHPISEDSGPDWVALARELGPRIRRARRRPRRQRHVRHHELRRAQGAPGLLGRRARGARGGGASHAELCAMLRTFGHYCSSTALALSMHTHQVAVAVWRWRHEGAPVEPFLRRVATEELDPRVDRGIGLPRRQRNRPEGRRGLPRDRRKIFGSGSPAGSLLMTMAIYDDPKDGPTVLHIPGTARRVQGSRSSTTGARSECAHRGSNDIVLDDVFVPDAAVGARRPARRLEPYLPRDVRDRLSARPLRVPRHCRELLGSSPCAKRRERPRTRACRRWSARWRTSWPRHGWRSRHMIDAAATRLHGGRERPTRSSWAARSPGAPQSGTVEKAMEVVGGASFFRVLGLERLFRDVQGVRFHPLQEKPQQFYTGRLALGLDVNG